MFNPRLLRTTADEEETPTHHIPQPTPAQDHALPSVQMMAFRPMTTSSPTSPGMAQLPMYYNQMQMNQINMMPGMFQLQGMPYGFGGNIHQGQQQPDIRPNYGFPVMQQQYLGMMQSPFAGGASFSMLSAQNVVAEQRQQERPQESQRNSSNQDNRNPRRDDRPSTNSSNQFAKIGSYNKQQDKSNSYSRDNYADRKERDNRTQQSGGYKPKQGFASSNPYADDYPDRDQNREKREMPRRNHIDSENLLAKRAPVHSSDRHRSETVEQTKLDISDEEEEIDEEALLAKNTEKVGEEKLALAGLIAPSLNTPDEISKWIKARKFNYPTRAKIAQKEEELIARGESGKLKESELSKLEVRLRKKLQILDYDPMQERNRQRDKRKLLERIGRKTKIRRTGKQDAPERKPEGDANYRPKNHKQDHQSPKKEGVGWQENKQPIPQVSNQKGASATTTDETRDDTSESTNTENLRYSLSHSSDEDSSQDDRPPVEVCMKKEIGVLAAMGAKQEDLAPPVKKESEVEPVNTFKKPPNKPTLTPESIIAHLMSRREEDSSAIENFMKAKSSTRNFKRQQGSLLSNLLLEDVYKERDTILQTLRYIMKSNFLKNPPRDLTD